MKNRLHNITKTIFSIKATFIVLTLISSYQTMASQRLERETHYYTAPQLDEDNIMRKGICVRPAHKEPYDLSIDQMGDKLVITTSGFGGSGITMGEGAVEYQIEKFQSEAKPYLKSNKDTEIAVIGSGLIGSLTALHLRAAGFTNVLIYADQKTATATPNAGGYIAASIDNSHPESNRYKQFCSKTFVRFSQCLSGKHPFMEGSEDAVRRVPIYRIGGKSPALESYVADGLMAPGFDVDLRIVDTEMTHQMYCYQDAMYVNPVRFLWHMHRQLNKHRVLIQDMHVSNVSELPSKIIFNCTGALAGKLTGKQENYEPTLGHYLLLGNQDSSTKELGVHNSMIVASGSEFTTGNGLKGRTSLNLFPKTSMDDDYKAYLGGTFIKNVKIRANGYVEPDYEFPELFEAVLDNARRFFGKPVA